MEPALDAILGQSSEHSLATGPEIPEPLISPFGLTMTAALSNDKAKKMYLSIVKNNKPLHDKIIKCVDIQVRTTDIGYLQNLETWIRQRTWEKYEDLIITSTEIEKKTKETYGQKLI